MKRERERQREREHIDRRTNRPIFTLSHSRGGSMNCETTILLSKVGESPAE